MTTVALTVATVFIVCFSIPFLLTVKIGSLLVSNGVDETIPSDPETVFPTSFRVARPGDAFKIAHSPTLVPREGEDYLFSLWFKLSKPLELGQRVVLLGKYDPKSKTRPGMSLALQRDLDGTRPVLYWGGEKTPGKWHTFAPIESSGRNWMLLSISFRKGYLLGMHAGDLNPAVPIQLLGGYELEPDARGANEADFVIGSFGDSEFRGRVGPVSVVTSSNLSESLMETISVLRTARDVPPANLSNSEIQLWVIGKQDASGKQNRISGVRPPMETKRVALHSARPSNRPVS